MKRMYTKKSYKLMEIIRTIILIIVSPLWFPLYLFVVLAEKIDGLLYIIDDLLQKVLDKIIPQIR